MPTEEQTYREGIKADLAEIKKMVKYTNGKVKKIILALAIVFGILIGQHFDVHQILAALIGQA